WNTANAAARRPYRRGGGTGRSIMRSVRASRAPGGTRGNDSQRHCRRHRGQGKHPAPRAERTAQRREGGRRGRTPPICDDVVGPQSAKIATNRFNAIVHEAYDTISWLIRLRSPTD